VFFDRHPQSGAWDHAMSWVGYQLLVGDQVYLYYGGYARGHKTERFTERQLGLVRMRRDRYVAREAGATGGYLRTQVVEIDGKFLTLNVDAKGGSVRAQVTDSDGYSIPGMTFADCKPITTDSVAAPLRWTRSFRDVRREPLFLEFEMRNARLYAINVR
jgi:hypothetical protein